MRVKNRGTPPNHSLLIIFLVINQSFWGGSLFRATSLINYKLIISHYKPITTSLISHVHAIIGQHQLVDPPSSRSPPPCALRRPAWLRIPCRSLPAIPCRWRPAGRIWLRCFVGHRCSTWGVAEKDEMDAIPPVPLAEVCMTVWSNARRIQGPLQLPGRILAAADIDVTGEVTFCPRGFASSLALSICWW